MTAFSRGPQVCDVASQLHGLSWTIHRLLPSLGADLDPLPASELAVLQRIVAEPGVTVSELATQLGLRQSNTSASVRTLIERGLVRRAPSPTDGRVALLHPTEQALKDKEAIEEAWSGAIGEAVLQLQPEDLTALLNAAPALRALDTVLRSNRTPGTRP